MYDMCLKGVSTRPEITFLSLLVLKLFGSSSGDICTLCVCLSSLSKLFAHFLMMKIRCYWFKFGLMEILREAEGEEKR